MPSCSDCHKAQTELNKLLTQTIKDGQEYSNQNNQEVIVYPTEKGFEFKPTSTYTGNVYIKKISPAAPGD